VSAHFTSKVPAVLLHDISKNAYIFLPIFTAESFPQTWTFDTYRWTSWEKKNYPYTQHFQPDFNQITFGSVTLVPAISPKRTNYAHLLSCFVSDLQKPWSALEPRTVSFGVVVSVPATDSPHQTTPSWQCSSFVLSFQCTEPIFTGSKTRGSFFQIVACSCNFITDIRKSDLGTMLTSRLFIKLKEPTSPGLEINTVFEVF
jgi:hypothetical protein